MKNLDEKLKLANLYVHTEDVNLILIFSVRNQSLKRI